LGSLEKPKRAVEGLEFTQNILHYQIFVLTKLNFQPRGLQLKICMVKQCSRWARSTAWGRLPEIDT
jgi:hypothetical protein